MKTILIISLLLFSTQALAFDGVIGFVGASFSNGKHHSGGQHLYGGKYLDLPTALSKITDYWIVNGAQGGAKSYNYISGATSWKGYNDQAWGIGISCISPDVSGTNLKVLVIDLVNDCKIQEPCNDSKRQEMFKNTADLINEAQFYGIKVIVHGYPDIPGYSDPVFNALFKNMFQYYPGVGWLEPWEGMVAGPDGLHPDTASVKNAALKLKELLISLGY